MAKWWQERLIYQIYPRSFQDTNGDGIGDIPGILMHLDELKELGVGIIWLSPVYPSPNADNGYDISDYRGIHPEYGTMSDMELLISEAEKRDIKIIMDLVINHTSDEHPWFQQSRDKSSPYRDYYIWRPGKQGNSKRSKEAISSPLGSSSSREVSKYPPNNWTSFFGEDCWEYDEKSGEYYLHLFAKKQPDLNWHNPKVLEEIKSIMRFWLDKGIAGFRCDVINILYKTSLDDGVKRLALTGIEHYLSQEGTHEILRTLRRDVLDHYDCFTVGETVFVTPQSGKELCDEGRRELNMIFSFEHMETDQFYVKWFKRRFHAGRLAEAIARWQGALDWNANYLENHDQPRSVSRFGNDSHYWAESAKLLCILLLTLRGTPFMFQGQEIGMTNFDFTGMDQIQDVESHNIYRLAKKLLIPAGIRWRMIRASSRDNARTPVQWNDSPNAGFTTGVPWLGINRNYTHINMASQMKEPGSIRSFYKSMIALRANSDILKHGSFKPLVIKKQLFIYERELDGQSLLIALNFSGRTRKIPRGLIEDDRNNVGNTSAVVKNDDRIIKSNYHRKVFDGLLQPYEALILKGGPSHD